jgi:hypothetical protein
VVFGYPKPVIVPFLGMLCKFQASFVSIKGIVVFFDKG